ncbi:uncharacterized protein AAEQ78_008133 isoform 1-T1 [Lycaon pictus]
MLAPARGRAPPPAPDAHAHARTRTRTAACVPAAASPAAGVVAPRGFALAWARPGRRCPPRGAAGEDAAVRQGRERLDAGGKRLQRPQSEEARILRPESAVNFQRSSVGPELKK